MDDCGGTWDILGYKDEVLVEWAIYDGATNSFDKGSSS
jgi:hypothetical protein